MKHASVRFPRTPSGVLALVLWALPGLAQRQEATPAERVAAVLESTTRPNEGARAAEQLARIGPAAIGPIFDRLAAGSLDTVRRAALLSALGLLPRDGVLAWIQGKVGPDSGDGERSVALDVLARLGSRPQLRLAIDLVSSTGGDVPPAPALQVALEQCLASICGRESGANRDLAAMFSYSMPSVQTAIIEALGQGEGAPSLLAGLLGRGSEGTDALLLSQIAECARKTVTDDLLVFERVRGYLGHPDKRLAILACGAVARLADDHAAPDLIILLCDEDAGVRSAGHKALRELTGLTLPPATEPWMSWLDESLAWWDERAAACRVAIVSGPPAEAAAAIQEVARQRLFVRDAVRLLALALHREEPDLVQSACRALGVVPPGAARAALHALAELPDSNLTRSVRDALCRSARPQPAAGRAIVLPSTRRASP